MVPHKRNSKVWPGLVTKEKTMKYPASATCTVYVYTRHPTKCHSHMWRVDTAPGKTRKKRNACYDVRRSAVEKQIASLNGIRRKLVGKSVIFDIFWIEKWRLYSTFFP